MEQREVLTQAGVELVRRPTLEEIFEQSYRRLVIQLYGIVGDADEAEDLVQEAFVRASAAGDRFARVTNHEAWLRRAAINLHRNRWRKWRNFTRVRPRIGPPADLPAAEEYVAVVQALRALPQAQREVIVLHYLADQPVRDVAATLGVAEGTVKSRLMRGRVALADLLGEDLS